MMKHIDQVLPKNLPENEKVDDHHKVGHNVDGSIKIKHEDDSIKTD